MADIARFAEETINTAVNAIQVNQIRCHSGDPGFTNLNEITSPGYTRKPCTFKQAISGDQGRRYLATEVEFDLSSNDSVTWISLWYDGAFVSAHKLVVGKTFVVDGKGKLPVTVYLSLSGVTVA